MIEQSSFDDMALPLGNHNEDLETISENKLRPLLDLELFHFCTQDRRDKGIDLTYELKRKGKHIGFRFIIQLKASESIIANKSDNSYSLQIDTSNINYLLNQNGPAFYILYIAQTNTFYYESMDVIVSLLQVKVNDWQLQDTHAIRFDKILNQKSFEQIYASAMKFGLLQRNLKEQATRISASVDGNERMSIDANYQLVSDSEIKKYIESYGISLINDGGWQEIIRVHKLATGQLIRSALYDLTLGIAYYYGGNRLDALAALKNAFKSENELDRELRDHLHFFDATVRFSIGLYKEGEFNSIIQHLGSGTVLGLSIALEKIKQLYLASIDNQKEDFDSYEKKVKNIITRPEASKSFVLFARCELSLFQGYKNNTDYITQVAKINEIDDRIGPVIGTRVPLMQSFLNANKKWSEDLESIITEARESNNSFLLFTALINHVKVSYQFDVFSKYFYVVKPIPGYPENEPSNDTEKYSLMERRIIAAKDYFRKVEHIENFQVASAAHFELLHYFGKTETAYQLLVELLEQAENFELNEQKIKLMELKNGGTTHETFKIFVGDQMSPYWEYDKLRKGMIQMDEIELNIPGKPHNGNYYIHLFPIGLFQFPVDRKNTMYEIVNISKNVQPSYDAAFGKIIPVANLFFAPVEQEGPLGGYTSYKGIIDWRRIYEIRKAFFENQFYRYYPPSGQSPD
jgi:hypothetical protein